MFSGDQSFESLPPSDSIKDADSGMASLKPSTKVKENSSNFGAI